MTASPMDPTDTQPERTSLAWQRTFISLIVVVGVGGLRVLTTGHAVFALVSVLICAIAATPIVLRQVQLRRHVFSVLTWQPPVLVGCILLFAVAGLLAISHGSQT